jgi:hypothetical protein
VYEHEHVGNRTTLKQLRLSGIRATLETRILESQAANLSFQKPSHDSSG